MDNKLFTYQYSAERNAEVEKIRERYIVKEESKLETVRRLDKRVQMAGTLEGLVIGVIGCLLFGVGMCFGLDALAGADWLTLLFCIIGAIVMLPAYPVYKYISNKTRKELAPEILKLSDEI
ncbi:MAG: hypothetical protein IJY65_02230 [Clostridia bacterium]|nr:hypothetical protein [Clostridia bacterium]